MSRTRPRLRPHARHKHHSDQTRRLMHIGEKDMIRRNQSLFIDKKTAIL